MAAGASQDASDYHAALRGHKASLEAVRETQLEHSAALKKLGERQDAHFAELGITQLDQFNHLRVLSTQLQAVSDQVEKLRATQLEHYAEHKADFASLKGDVRTLQGDVSSLKGDVSSLKGDVRTLKGDVSSLRGDLAVVKDDVAEIKVGMTRIVQAVEKLSGGSAERGTGQQGSTPASGSRGRAGSGGRPGVAGSRPLGTVRVVAVGERRVAYRMAVSGGEKRRLTGFLSNG